MGDPKLKRKTFRGPSHPWEKDRIIEEGELLSTYGLKNKRELWKHTSLLKKFMRQAKKVIASGRNQEAQEARQLVQKLSLLGLLLPQGKVEDVLTISVKDILNRRLQTLVHKKQLARTVRQARQFIIHEHILVGEHKITQPSYLVSLSEESGISVSPSSSLSSIEHPERVILPPRKEKPKKRSRDGEGGRGRGRGRRTRRFEARNK